MDIEKALRRMEARLEHQHQMLHNLMGAVADIARQLRKGGMTPEEEKAVVDRLNAHAEALEGIAATPPTMPPSD